MPHLSPVLAAVHKTLLAKSWESLTTRILHSELVFNYSGSKHMKAIEKLVSGKEIDLEELLERVNQAHVRKNYQISDPELGISSLADAIACRISGCHAL